VRSADLRVDVGAAAGLDEPLSIAVTAHVPDDPASVRAAIVAYPGSGYNRSYFDLSIDGDDSYSQARHHSARGIALVACDHLCVGESSTPSDPLALTLEQLAAANARAASVALDALGGGALAGISAIPPTVPRIGIGQSMGGCLLTVQQALHRSFDAVALLGWSAVHTTFPDPSGIGRVRVTGLPRGTDLHTITAPPYQFTYEQLRNCYHFDDVPPSIVDPDIAAAFDRTLRDLPSWRSPGSPPCSKCMVTPGVIAREAAAIDVPVLSLWGERDTTEHPTREPAAYSGSPAADVVVMPAMGHMHNFAGTRRLFWDVLVSWIDTIAVR
jgi:pimeloyl-ACP methyl ester carboxylesterase